MIRTVFTSLVMFGALMVTVPWALLVLVSSLFVASVLVFLAWLLVHALLLMWIPSENLAALVSLALLALLALCLPSGWALTLWAWADHFGIAALFAGAVMRRSVGRFPAGSRARSDTWHGASGETGRAPLPHHSRLWPPFFHT